MDSNKYGKFFWVVSLSKGTTAYAHGDSFEVVESGALLFWRQSEKNGTVKLRCFAPGQWVSVAGAYQIDIAPVAVVEQWESMGMGGARLYVA